MPSNGLVLNNKEEKNLQNVLDKGCWTPVETFASSDEEATWSVKLHDKAGRKFDVLFEKEVVGTVSWSLMGMHNISNALASIAAARHVGVPAEYAIAALAEFKGVKRRMQLRGEINQISVYDDFAHHPTAIKTTLSGLRNSVGEQKIIAILEPRSNTMQMGVHENSLADSLVLADEVILFQPEGMDLQFLENVKNATSKAMIFTDVDEIVSHVAKSAKASDQVLVMSNGGFGGIHDKILAQLEARS